METFRGEGCCVSMGWIDILPLVLVGLFLVGLKSRGETTGINEDYLSLDTGNSLRGFFAMVVVLHHLAQRTEAGWLFQFFEHVGHLPVAAYFFLSGYGLQKSYMTSENYQKRFLRRRLPKILLPYAAVTFLYWLLSVIQGTPYSLQEIFTAILWGSPIVAFSWYIVCICCFYVAFSLFMRICKDNYRRMILCAGIWFVVYLAVCLLLGYGTWWYLTPHLLVFGMLWATCEARLVPAIKARYSRVTLLITGGFLVFFILKLIIGSGVAANILVMIFSVFFVVSMLLLTMKYRIKSRIFGFLGRISLDVYLLHGLFIMGLRWDGLYIEDDFLWSLAVLAGSLVSGLVFHKGIALLQKTKN